MLFCLVINDDNDNDNNNSNNNNNFFNFEAFLQVFIHLQKKNYFKKKKKEIQIYNFEITNGKMKSHTRNQATPAMFI